MPRSWAHSPLGAVSRFDTSDLADPISRAARVHSIFHTVIRAASAQTSRAMLHARHFLQALIALGTIVCITYCFMHFTAYSLLWLIGELSFKPGDNRRQPADRTMPDRLLQKT
jgi:hypothetical protein